MSKTICVTGGAGFIAHHAIETILNTTDWNIVTIDRLDFSGNFNRLQNILENNPEKKRVKVVYHDLRAPINPQTNQFLKEFGEINYVAHMAAACHVDRSIDYPMEFVMDNVVGTCNILDWARELDSLERFIYFSTDEVFGPAPEGVKYKEWDRYNSSSPYSASKAGGEELAVAYQNTYKMPIYISHTMNVFGERQHPEKYIPMCIKRVRDDEVITVHSNPEKTKAGSRHYIHAQDASSAMIFLMSKNIDIETQDSFGVAKNIKFNIVGPNEIDNLTLANKIAECQGKSAKTEMVNFHASRPGHDLRYSLDNSLMESLGWKPTKTFDERIQQVSDWYLQNKEWL